MAMSPERIVERAAARKREKYLNSLTPIAHAVQVEEKGGTTFLGVWEGSVEITGTKQGIEQFNSVLERLGYRPVRLTSNMLNPQSKVFAIDINTPSYCDPGCESYHSA